MKHFFRHAILLFAVLCPLGSYSQTNLRDLGKKVDRHQKAKKTVVKAFDRVPVAADVNEDTVYCFQTTKRHGWFEPLGLLTKEQVRHRSQSFMFSRKNGKGHWTKMESVDAYGKHVPSRLNPYIAKVGSEKDSLVNEEWVEKLKSSCIFEFIPDPSEENIIQERAFDKEHNLLYAYSRIPVGLNQFVGSYKDFFGLPAEMREETGYKYGTLVLITEDEHGYDKRVEYIDAQRRNKPNADGAYAEMFDYNDKGEIIRQYSVDSIGNRIKDNWGNCGIIATYDGNHLMKSQMYADEWLNPMRMPSPESGNTFGTIKSVYQYDSFFRPTQAEFFTESDEKDTNAYGCHKIVMEYDDWGNEISTIGYDMDGNLAAMDASGTAKYLFCYDKNGNCSEIQFLDKFNKPVSTSGYFCKFEYEYDDDNRLISEKKWYNESENIELSYLFEICEYPDYKENKTIWNDGSSRIVRFDKKNREILTAFYKADGSPDSNYENTWSYKTTEYTEIDKHKTRYVVSYFGTDGILSQSENLDYNRKVAICDSITKQEFYKDYKNGLLVNTFSKKYNDDFTKITEQADNNVFGNITRAGGASGVRHYNAKVKWTPFSDINYIVCVDEFGEPDYLVADDGSISYYQRTTLGGTDKMLVENELLDSVAPDNLRDVLPKVMSVEVVDSVAYSLGLRDNDVILIYGDYSVDLNNIPSYNDFRRDWALASILESCKPSRMVAFRVEDAEKHKYGLVEINNLMGTPSELGILAHIRYLTQHQKARILSAIESDIMSSDPVVTASNFSDKKISDGNNYVILACPDMFRARRNFPYAKHIADPAILLGACIKDRDLYWALENGEDTDAFEHMLDSRKSDSFRYPVMNMYLTTDMRDVKPLCLKDQVIGTYWFDTEISDDDYSTLLKLNRFSLEKIDSIKSRVPSFNPESLIGSWRIVPNDSVKDYEKTTGYLSFSKNGTCEGELISYGAIPLLEDGPIYRIGKDYKGIWSINDSLIIIRPSVEDNIRLACVDLIGTYDEVLKNRTVAYMNTLCETEKDDLLGRMICLSTSLGNDLFISSITKDSLFIDNGTKCPVAFAKVNGKAKGSLSNKKKEPVKTEHSNDRKETILDPRLIGSWETEIPNIQGSLAILILGNDGSMNLTFKATVEQELTDSIGMCLTLNVKIGGKWDFHDDVMKLIDDPSQMSVIMDLDLSGVSDDQAEWMKPMIMNDFSPIKDELVKHILTEGLFGDEISVSEITESSFVINEKKWWRHKE